MKRRPFGPPLFFPTVRQLLEKLHRIDQRLQHAERQWNADESPSQRKLQRRGAFLVLF
jgi:hypothetical protein